MSNIRKFAPLNPVLGESDLPKLNGIVFDVDGTLCKPQNYMFAEMRSALGISKSIDILDHIYSLPSPQQETAMESIRKIEREAMGKQTPQPGLAKVMGYLTSRGIQKAICSRNFEQVLLLEFMIGTLTQLSAPVDHLLTKFLPSEKFYPVITREFRPPKPSPAGIIHISSKWELPSATNLIMVGDSIDDMTAGRLAGTATVLLVNDVNKDLTVHPNTDLVISRLDELIEILEGGFSGRDTRDKGAQ